MGAGSGWAMYIVAVPCPSHAPPQRYIRGTQYATTPGAKKPSREKKAPPNHHLPLEKTQRTETPTAPEPTHWHEEGGPQSHGVPRRLSHSPSQGGPQASPMRREPAQMSPIHPTEHNPPPSNGRQAPARTQSRDEGATTTPPQPCAHATTLHHAGDHRLAHPVQTSRPPWQQPPTGPPGPPQHGERWSGPPASPPPRRCAASIPPATRSWGPRRHRHHTRPPQ